MEEYQYKWDAFSELNKTVAQEAIVFAGDSITEGFPLYELFPQECLLYNRGISGITAVQLLEHIEVHILQLSPKKLFLLIGTNDLGRGRSVLETEEAIELICTKTMTHCPECKIYLFSVYPINKTVDPMRVWTRDNDSISQLNEKIERISKSYKAVELVNLADLLKDEKGDLRAEYTYDGLHLKAQGYREVAKRLLELL